MLKNKSSKKISLTNQEHQKLIRFFTLLIAIDKKMYPHKSIFTKKPATSDSKQEESMTIGQYWKK